MPDTLDKVVHLEQLKILYRNLNVNLPGSLFVLSAVLWASWELYGVKLLWLLAAMLVLSALRLADRHVFQKALAQGRADPDFWEKRAVSGALLVGIFWGITFPIVFTPERHDLVLFVICFYAGLISAGSAAHAPRISSFLAFVLPTSIPLIYQVFYAGGRLYIAMGFAFMVFVIASLVVANTYSRIIRDSIRLRFENNALISSLTTEKARAEQNQLVAEQAVITKDRFLAAASHDLRQPLHAQGLYLDALEPHVQTDGVRYLQALYRTNHSLTELFNSLLDVSRLNAGIVEVQLSHFNLASIVSIIFEEYESQAKEKNLVLSTYCQPYIVFSDPLLLQRIISNLISNALRYTQQGQVSVSCQLVGQKVELVIEDTGIGIPQSEQEHIFDEYYQLDNPERDRSKGLGLGLAIVKKLCLLLDIPLTCISQVGQGSRFTVQLPLGDGQLVEQRKTLLPLSPLQNISVLVIDDNQEILNSMQALLSTWGCQSWGAESAEQGIELLNQAQVIPDLMVADYRLRENATGAAAIQQVRAYYQMDLPALLITGDTSEERLREANASGLYLLHKPVAPARLRVAMSVLLPHSQ
ncbi:ATP-binding response regulator [Thiolinea disciformis]|uniref:ATP-binding response regulator n=1 Tax=Thiolinea disciformis TaxID=125614 RepID=UPI00035E60F4|nr:hybrid sensor histidine kinase/response regulator [Thiolinea disciformis]